MENLQIPVPKLEFDYPLPRKGHPLQGVDLPFDILEVGQSFSLDITQYRPWRETRTYLWSKRPKASPKQFTSKLSIEDGMSTLRFWRTA